MSVRDTGILRKRTHAHSGGAKDHNIKSYYISNSSTICLPTVLKQPQTSTEDLLIIGYQSHLFRDDEKAQLIDQGTHLIGWMGEESLKIDRLILLSPIPSLSPRRSPVHSDYYDSVSLLTTSI